MSKPSIARRLKIGGPTQEKLRSLNQTIIDLRARFQHEASIVADCLGVKADELFMVADDLTEIWVLKNEEKNAPAPAAEGPPGA